MHFFFYMDAILADYLQRFFWPNFATVATRRGISNSFLNLGSSDLGSLKSLITTNLNASKFGDVEHYGTRTKKKAMLVETACVAQKLKDSLS